MALLTGSLAAGELGRAELVEHVAPDDAVACGGARFGGRGPGAVALLCHALLEIVEVDAAIAAARELAREVDREPEGVVEEERVGPAHIAAIEDLSEQLDAALQRGAEGLLLALDDLRDVVATRDDLGVRTRPSPRPRYRSSSAARDHARRAGTSATLPAG